MWRRERRVASRSRLATIMASPIGVPPSAFRRGLLRRQIRWPQRHGFPAVLPSVAGTEFVDAQVYPAIFVLDGKLLEPTYQLQDCTARNLEFRLQCPRGILNFSLPSSRRVQHNDWGSAFLEFDVRRQAQLFLDRICWRRAGSTNLTVGLATCSEKSASGSQRQVPTGGRG